MRHYTILLLPGDGIGPEVTREAVRVLAAIGQHNQHSFDFTEAPIGGAALDDSGVPLPAETLERCQRADAILLGAVGGPRWDGVPTDRRPERGLLDLRRALGVFANLRPARALASVLDVSPLRPEVVVSTDLLIVRELTGGLYFGEPRLLSDDEAVDTLRYRREEIARVARVALTLARSRRRRVASVDKANVLASSQLWRSVVTEVAREFPDVTLAHILVDTAAMLLVRSPADFDVILTENMFGDILSDLAGGIVGSIGLLPSASIGANPPALYEPVHGAAPDIAGRGVANPLGAILSAAMLLRHSFALEEAATRVEQAVEQVLREVRPPDLGGRATTKEVGDAVINTIALRDTGTPAARREGGR